MPNVVLSDKTKYKNPSYRKNGKHFEKKKHSLVIDSQGASNREVRTESGTLKFENGVAMLPHDTRARDIVDEMNASEALHPQQYALIENKSTVNVDKTHRYHFGWSKVYERSWKRAFGKSRNDPDIEEDTNA